MGDEAQKVQADIDKATLRIEQLEAKMEALSSDAVVSEREKYLQESILLLRREKELLLQRLPPAQGPDIEDKMRKVFQEEFARRDEQAKGSKGFSDVGSTEAEGLLAELKLEEVNGNDMEPIDVPNDAPQARDFPYEEYPDENSGTPFLLDHHAEQLAAYGIRFGRGGYKTYDLSRRNIYSFTANSGQRYSGTVDGCIAPYGLMASTACNHSRIAYEHKQSQEQKRAYREMHPEQYKVTDTETPSGQITFDGGYKGQSVTAMLGAYAYNDFPLMIDLTDGVVHHLLQVRGTDSYMWTDLSAKQAYYKQAELLRSLPDLLPDRKLQMEAIPEDLQIPLKKMRSLRSSSGVKEQLDSVLPFLPMSERLSAAQEIIASWAQAAPRPMSSDVLTMFGWNPDIATPRGNQASACSQTCTGRKTTNKQC